MSRRGQINARTSSSVVFAVRVNSARNSLASSSRVFSTLVRLYLVSETSFSSREIRESAPLSFPVLPRRALPEVTSQLTAIRPRERSFFFPSTHPAALCSDISLFPYISFFPHIPLLSCSRISLSLCFSFSFSLTSPALYR